MRCGEYTKIGITNDPAQRLSQIQTSNPVDVNLVFTGKVLNTEMVERKLHYILREWRVRGEWFKMPKELVEAVIEDIRDYKEKLHGYTEAG